MMNCGVILPKDGYLQGLRDLCHKNGAFLAYDEVKTGCTIAYGGAVEAFGVTPDIVCLAKAVGGGLPGGAIGATEELYRPVIEGVYDMAGTYNGNPLTMAAAKASLTEVLTRDAYDHFRRIHSLKLDLSQAVACFPASAPQEVLVVGADGFIARVAPPRRVSPASGPT